MGNGLSSWFRDYDLDPLGCEVETPKGRIRGKTFVFKTKRPITVEGGDGKDDVEVELKKVNAFMGVPFVVQRTTATTYLLRILRLLSSTSEPVVARTAKLDYPASNCTP